MPAAVRGRKLVGNGRTLLQIGVLVLSVWPMLAGLAVAADPPAANGPAPNQVSNAKARQRRRTEYQRLSKQAGQLAGAGRIAEAIEIGQRAVLVAHDLYGDVSEQTAGLYDWLATQYEREEGWSRARQSRQEVLAIRRKLYGDKDWRVTNAQLAVQNLDLRSRLTTEQRGELVKADKLISEVVALRGKGQSGKGIPLATRAIEIHRRLLGSEHPETAVSCLWLGYAYLSAGRYVEAEPYYQQSLEIRRQVLGDEHPDTATSLNNLGLLYKSMANYAKAESFYRRALEIRERVLGEKNGDTAISVNNLAGLYQAMGAYAKAEPLYRRALEIRKSVFGEERLETAAAFNNLANLCISMADYAAAEPLCLKALEINRKILGDQHPSTATSLGNLAGLYESMGDYAKAKPYFEQVLELQRSVLGAKSPETATSLDNLAGLYLRMGDYGKAESFAYQALKIDRELFGEKNPQTAAGADFLASVYSSLGEYSKAEPLLREAFEIRKKLLGEAHLDTAASLNDLAGLYQSMGDFTKAEPLFQQALEIRKKILGEKHPTTALSLNNLALLYIETKDNGKAEPLFRQALEIKRTALGAHHPDIATGLHNLAGLYFTMEDYAKAEPLFLQALEINRKSRVENYPRTAVNLQCLSLVYRAMGDFAKAESAGRQALEIRRNVLGDKHPETAETLNNLAMLYRSKGDYAQAEQHSRQALEIFQRLMDQTLGGFAERQQLTFEADRKFYLHNYLSLAGPAQIGDANLYGYVLKNKGAVTARQSLVRAERLRPELKQAFEDLQVVSTRLGNLALASPDPRHPEVRLRQIEQLTEQKESLEKKLAAQSGDFAQIRAAVRLTPVEQIKKLRAALGAQATLVDFLEYRHSSTPRAKKGLSDFEQRLLAFVIRPDGEIHKVELGPTAPIAKAVAAWRQAYGAPGSSDPGIELRKLLWQPLEPFLTGADTILVSPDGPLHQFPFAALPGTKPGRYLLEERRIVVVPIPRLLPELLAGSAKPAADSHANTPLLIGDINFDSAGESPAVEVAQSDTVDGTSHHRSAVLGQGGEIRFPHLPGTADEIQEIGALYRKFGSGELRLLSGSAATATAFRRDAPEHRWLHIATHGFFAPETVRSALERPAADEGQRTGRLFGSAEAVRGYHPGLLSGIVFAGANVQTPAPQSATSASAAPDEGIMTALEVADLDLSSVDLVVLSACETGLGHVAGGEGVMGLQRAFELAGARTCVASLWKVDDSATQVLMKEFYSNLWQKKLGKLESLRQAQLRMLREYDPKQRKLASRGLDVSAGDASDTPRGSPFFWAAFVLSGDWR
jgi:CHAT domain-containing protein/Tfp pilus assembly protein PilF